MVGMRYGKSWGIAFIKENKVNFMVWILFLFVYYQSSYSSFEKFFIEQFLFMSFMTIGVSIEMLCGNFDLSFAAQMAASTVLAAYLLKEGGPLWLACLLVVMFHALAGALKGILIAKMRIPSIIITLALQIILTNLFAVITKGNSIIFRSGKIYYNDFYFKIIVGVLFVVMLMIAVVFLNHTYYGRYCRMIGEDMELTERSGLSCGVILVIIHVLASFFFSIPSIIILLQTSSGSAVMGTNYLYKVLAAACLGGVGYQNGKGRISGMLAGTISMVLILFLLSGKGYLSRWEGIIEGIIILSTVLNKRYKENS